jgi:chemotaxis regulatin CheY-phosphate phosphatase CheZ
MEGTLRRNEVLSDSEATLRQVRGAVERLASGEPESDDVGRSLEAQAAGLAELVKMVVTTYSEIMAVIESLRKSRGLLEQASMEKIRGTHTKLAEVSNATETAATGILDGLDRALGMIDVLDDDGAPTGETASVRSDLRQELHKIMDLLQFQDITSQQLGYASGVLFDVEQRMVQLCSLFDSGIGMAGLDLQSSVMAFKAQTCDPNASTLNAEGRQALADEIFTKSDAD